LSKSRAIGRQRQPRQFWPPTELSMAHSAAREVGVRLHKRRQNGWIFAPARLVLKADVIAQAVLLGKVIFIFLPVRHQFCSSIDRCMVHGAWRDPGLRRKTRGRLRRRARSSGLVKAGIDGCDE